MSWSENERGMASNDSGVDTSNDSNTMENSNSVTNTSRIIATNNFFAPRKLIEYDKTNQLQQLPKFNSFEQLPAPEIVENRYKMDNPIANNGSPNTSNMSASAMEPPKTIVDYFKTNEQFARFNSFEQLPGPQKMDNRYKMDNPFTITGSPNTSNLSASAIESTKTNFDDYFKKLLFGEGASYAAPTSVRVLHHSCISTSSHKLRNHKACKSRISLQPYSCAISKQRKLRLAASLCNTELIMRLLDDGVNPDSADEHKRSPLHLAASRGYLLHSNLNYYHFFLCFSLLFNCS